MNLQHALMQDVRSGLVAAGFSPPKGGVVINKPEKREHGDYATPVALALSKQTGKTPMEIVEAIAEHMPKKEYIGALEGAQPGFLNIKISDKWLISRLDDVIEGNVCGSIDIGEGKLVNLEFISANPTGPLTLGNARTAFSADTLANVLECAGFNVTREYYINDAGVQIRRLGESVLRRALILNGEKVEFSEDLYQGEYIEVIAQTIAEQWRENDNREFAVADLEDAKVIAAVSTEAMEQCLAVIKKTVHDELRIHMDVWTSERALRKSGEIERTLQELKDKKLTFEKEGAVWLKTTDLGEPEDKVLVKQDGEYAYILPDIAYHRNKYEREFDLIFTFLGADHQGQVPKISAAISALGYDAGMLRFVVAQWMSLMREGKEIKPSKRRGIVYSPTDLIGEIGYDAARFFMIQRSLNTHLTIDLDIAQEKSDRNPVYYIQYAYVRLQSILRKAKEQGIIDDVGQNVPLPEAVILGDASELALLRVMYGLPEVISSIATTFEVQALPYYATDLAGAVHAFYRDAPVLTSEDKNIVLSRLQLVSAAKNVLGGALDLMGVSKPDVM